jgi:dephospho-CoA kinase
MRLIGLTGGIASGKSTVARMLAARGAAVIDADRIGRALQEPGTPCHAAILEAFGPDVRDASGRLDRRRLADAVFSDAAARRRLEGIMHPAIWSAAMAEAASAEAAGYALCVVDAALILEAGWRERFDAVIVVVAPEAAQLERLRLRGLREGEARERLAAQWPAAAKAAQADVVIDTGGTLADTEARVAQVYPTLLAAGRRRSVSMPGERDDSSNKR